MAYTHNCAENVLLVLNAAIAESEEKVKRYHAALNVPCEIREKAYLKGLEDARDMIAEHVYCNN